MKHSTLMVLTLALLVQAATAFAAPVFKDGKEWLQPADFTNLSFAQIDAVCPASAGRVCTGSIDGTDVTGFVFASIADVRALMASYGAPAPDHCTGAAAREPDSSWLPAILADFGPTAAFPDSRFVEGNVSDASICAAIDDPTCDFVTNGFIGVQSEDSRGDGFCAGPGDIRTGVWLYRPLPPAGISTLSLPGLLLLALGLILLAGWGHRSSAPWSD